MKKKIIIGVLVILVMFFLIFKFEDFKDGFKEGVNAALKTEQAK
ncbi:hypothetical protein [Clostridium perfringens]|nr:hypothetical protein [Clostridium perfringens]